MISAATPGTRSHLIRLLLAAPVLAGLMACGGGGGASNPASTLNVTAPASKEIPVPYNFGSQGFYLPPYATTVPVTLIRNGMTGPATLTVTGLPANVKAAFAEATTTGSSDELTIQAGYPDPTDPSFTRQLYPATGTYPLTITAKIGGTVATTSLSLKLVNETPDFDLQWVTADGTTLDNRTDLVLAGAAPATLHLLAYYNNSRQWPTSGPVTMGLLGAPAGLTVNLGASAYSLDDTVPHAVTFTANPAVLAAGTYNLAITASYNGLARTLPGVVTYSPAPFYLLPQLNAAGPSVVQGGSVSLPLHLGHADAYFGTTAPADGTDPLYVGDTQILIGGAPAGLDASLASTSLKGLACATLNLTASAGLTPGTYPLTLTAVRTAGATTTYAPAITLPVTVTSSALGAMPVTWIQAVEWGQTVVKPDLALVAGKPALLRVHYLADRPGQPAVLTATLQDHTALTLAGPASVPTASVEGDLPIGGNASASTFTALLPGSAVQPGLAVTLQVAGLDPVTVTPTVVASRLLPLTVVPIIHGGTVPVLPSGATLNREMTAFWPVQGVNLTQRAAYTTSTVIPTPDADPSKDHSVDGWAQLLSEVATLRTLDASASYYYGFFNPNFPATFTGGSVVGLSYQGRGVGIGLDTVAAAEFQNDDPGHDNATMIMVHEEGHAFNLDHAPAGGAGLPQLNYPYAGALIGTWGYDPAAQAAYSPASYYDVMSYAAHTHWVSDWDYLAAMGWLNGEVHAGGKLSPLTRDRWLVSGWVDPAGAVHVAPLVRAQGVQAPAVPGTYRLTLRTTAGDLEVPFAASQVQDLPAGYRQFAFTVPAVGEATGLDLSQDGRRLLRKASPKSLAERRATLAADAATGLLQAEERDGVLHLRWDAATHPYVNVLHEGAARTTLALHLTGGAADLPLAGVPAGGRFVIHYSDGLEPVVRDLPRRQGASLD